MLGAINRFETKIRAERQTDGINQAKQKRIKFGAAGKLNESQVEEMKEKRPAGVLIKDLMGDYKLSKAGIYRYLETQAEKL